jgi:hypothetical protein
MIRVDSAMHPRSPVHLQITDIGAAALEGPTARFSQRTQIIRHVAVLPDYANEEIRNLTIPADVQLTRKSADERADADLRQRLYRILTSASDLQLRVVKLGWAFFKGHSKCIYWEFCCLSAAQYFYSAV